MNFCVSVTDKGLKSLSRLQSLQDLNLCSCVNISDIGVGFLAEGSAISLRTIDANFCDCVSDSVMAHAATGLASVTSLLHVLLSHHGPGSRKEPSHQTKPCYLQQNKGEAETKTDSRVCHWVNLLSLQLFLCDAKCFRKK